MAKVDSGKEGKKVKKRREGLSKLLMLQLDEGHGVVKAFSESNGAKSEKKREVLC